MGNLSILDLRNCYLDVVPIPRNPTEVVFPLISATTDLKLGRHFLGTAFMVSPTRFITARHCLANLKIAGDEKLAGVFGLYDELAALELSDIEFDPKFDVCHGTVLGRPADAEYLTISESTNILTNVDVLTVEYSGTESNKRLQDGRTAMEFTPFFRKGNIVASRLEEVGLSTPTNCLDLSFPALKGASGAPVMYADSGLVVGMVIRNFERQLMPAQVESITRVDGTIETEVKYFLPIGQAIRSEYLLPHASSD